MLSCSRAGSCGYFLSNEDVKERWHKHYGVQELGRGSGEIGVPVVGKVKLRKETLLMVCVRDHEPAVPGDAGESERGTKRGKR